MDNPLRSVSPGSSASWDEREVFDLVGIQGLTQAEVATVVGVSEKTVQRRLGRARLLAEPLADLCPSTPGGPAPSPGETPPL
jgi:RNA polymerase sigma-70 factor (ECF subfamily)